MTTAKAPLILTLLLAAGTAARAEDEIAGRKFQVTLSGSASIFQGGDTDDPLGAAFSFQPEVTSPGFGGSVTVHFARHVAAELEVTTAFDRTKNDRRTPLNTFVTGGVVVPWPMRRGRLVPYLSAGAGAVRREARDFVQDVLEEAFAVRGTDPLGYLGAGAEWRLTRLLGVRADYRYLRVFPDDVADLELDRPSYGAHRFTGGVTFSF